MEITVFAQIRARGGREDETKKALLDLVGPTRLEAGCITYDLHQSTEDAAIFMFYERWKSKEDLDRHLKMPYLQDFIAKSEALLATPVDIQVHTLVSPRPA